MRDLRKVLMTTIRGTIRDGYQREAGGVVLYVVRPEESWASNRTEPWDPVGRSQYRLQQLFNELRELDKQTSK